MQELMALQGRMRWVLTLKLPDLGLGNWGGLGHCFGTARFS